MKNKFNIFYGFMVVITFLILVVAPVGIADAQDTSTACSDNFSESGSYFTGRQFKTWQNFAKVKYADAYKRAYSFTAKAGFTITSHDKEIGVITAQQSLSQGKQPKTAILNISINELKQKGIKVEINFNTPSGASSPTEAIKKHFCDTMTAVEGR